VKGFVDSAGGTIEVISPPAPGKPHGTAFILTLPTETHSE
jgi:signal transduction histidine kinase